MKLRMTLLTIILAFCVSSLFAQDITLRPGSASDAGMDESILAEGVRLYKEAVDRDEMKGAVLLVARKGIVVVHEPVGLRDVEKNLPMEKNTMFRMASNTKPTIAAAISILVDEGKLNYNDNVRKHIPAFDNYRSGFIKIHHLLTHTSGFRIGPIFYRPLIQKSAEHPDAPSLVLEIERFGETGATEIPGTSYSYSNAGFNTLGALIEIASGQSMESFLKERLYNPLGMADSYNHEIAKKLDGKLNRMGVIYRSGRGRGARTAGWKPGDPPDYPIVRASGGMISTAWDYAIFCQMFLNGGVYNGTKILNSETVEIMTSPQTESIYTPEQLERQNSFYGYGWRVSRDGVFSHSGSDGTSAWVDPGRELIVLVFTQSPGGRKPNERFMQLIQASINER